MTALSKRLSLRRRLAEIAVRRGVDAIGAGAEIDPVQIDFEDLVLGEAALEPQRQQRLADLAREAALRGQEQDLGELLGDRAAALDDMAGAQIGDRGAHQPDRVDAEMAVEAAVLGRDHRLRQVGRHLLQGQRLAEQIAEGGDQAAVGGEDRDARPPLGDGELARCRAGSGRNRRARTPPMMTTHRNTSSAELDDAAEQAPRRGRRVGGRARRPRLRGRRRTRTAILGIGAQRPVSHPSPLQRPAGERRSPAALHLTPPIPRPPQRRDPSARI